MSIIDVIKASPLFHELYDKEIDTIINRSNVLSLEEGDYIIKDGDEGNEIYIMLTGEAVVKKGEAILAELKKGDLFGELVLLNERKRTADIIAKSYSDVLMLNYDAIFDLYRTEPKIFSLLILNLSRLLTVRLKNSGLNIKALQDDNIKLRNQIEQLKK